MTLDQAIAQELDRLRQLRREGMVPPSSDFNQEVTSLHEELKGHGLSYVEIHHSDRFFEAMKRELGRKASYMLTVQVAEETARRRDGAKNLTLLALLTETERTFASGYRKERIFHLLKRTPLSEPEIAYLQGLYLRDVHRSGREFGRFNALAAARLRTPEFEKAIADLASHPQAYVKERAQRLLQRWGRFS